jgi:MFS family permease
VHRKGAGSFANLSIYAVGLSGLWTALGTPILPIKVEEIIADNGSNILGFMFNENDKNGALGIVSLTGLAAAALTQPVAGVLSDRRSGPTKRLPYLLIGAIGMAVTVLFLGLVGTLFTLIALNILIQGLGNFGQGAANGLIADHVPAGKKGSAAGALNFARVAGAGVMTGVVLLLMSQYDKETAPGWMMVSLALVATISVIATLWTITSLRRGGNSGAAGTAQAASAFEISPPAGASPAEQIDEIASAAGVVSSKPETPRDNYFRFLVSLTVVIIGFSSLQLYSFFYLQDVVGLDNPAQGAVVILLTTAVATALTVRPAGHFADRVGRDPMLYAAGVFGVLSTLILMFAESLIVVALVGIMVGVVIGIFLTVTWALANDLVSRRNAARDLGYASVAVLIGSAVSRISGLGVDRLNDLQHALGYQVVLGAVAVCFALAAVMMTRLERTLILTTSDTISEGVMPE